MFGPTIIHVGPATVQGIVYCLVVALTKSISGYTAIIALPPLIAGALDTESHETKCRMHIHFSVQLASILLFA